MNVEDLKVDWHERYMNMPSLCMLLKGDRDDKPEIPYADRWRLIPIEGGNYLLNRSEPAVHYVFESKHGGGALGMTKILEDGTEYKMNGGWSSNAGAINRLRALDERFSEYLPYDVVSVSYYGGYKASYNGGWGMGIAGAPFDLPWIEKLVEKYLPDVELFDLTDRVATHRREEHQASAEQGMIIGGVSAYGHIPVVAGLLEHTRETIKPAVDSDLFKRTTMPRGHA